MSSPPANSPISNNTPMDLASFLFLEPRLVAVRQLTEALLNSKVVGKVFADFPAVALVEIHEDCLIDLGLTAVGVLLGFP